MPIRLGPLWLGLLALALARASEAGAEFQVPPLTGPVVDQANLLSDATKTKLAAFLTRVQAGGGSQLQVLTVPELHGLSIEEASIRVTDQWKIGSAKDDNGVLLMVAARERRLRIEVGQGLEGVLTDVLSSRIIREVIRPRLREGQADAAITAGVLAILHYTDPKVLESEGTAWPEGKARWSGKKIEFYLWLFFLLFFVIPSFFMRRSRRSLWGIPLGGGGWSSTGSGWGGGFGGGGGWSGGGGGFSGGGASGGW